MCITPSWGLLGNDEFVGAWETGMARIQREWWSCMQANTPLEVVEGGHKFVNDAVQAPHQCCLDQVYRCANLPFSDGGWRRASLSVRHFAIFLAIAPSPSPNLHRIARKIAKDTLFAIYVGQWHDRVTGVSCPPVLKLSTVPSLRDPKRGLDTLQGDILCWRALLCPFRRPGPSKWVMGLHLWIWRKN